MTWQAVNGRNGKAPLRCRDVHEIGGGYNTEISLQEYRAASSALPSYTWLVTLHCGRTAELVKLRCSGTAFGESSHLTRALTGYIRIASDMAP